MTALHRQPRILAIDDDTLWLEQLPMILSGLASVVSCAQIDEALGLLESECFDVVLLDLNFKGDVRSGLDVFKEVFALNTGADVIVISGETDPLRLVDVFNAGVTRFIPKPASIDAIRLEVSRVLDSRRQRAESLESFVNQSGKRNPLVGTSSAIQRLRSRVDELARIGFKDLLIEGETGSGKEVMARFLALGLSPGSRFLPMHCGAISEGLAESELFGHVKGAFTGADKDRIGVFEAAAGGFVFLDEIGEMPPSQQAKLLRVIQERKIQRVGSFEERQVSFRTISATHVNLVQAIGEKKFREDLYFRISKERLQIPSLRERRDDIPVLIKSFGLKTLSGAPIEFSGPAMQILVDYDWPGNVRQLAAITEGIAARATQTVIREREVCTILPEALRSAGAGLVRASLSTYANAVVASERKRFEKALIQAKGSRVDAAKLLGLSRATYFRRAKELGLIGLRLPMKTIGERSAHRQL